VNYWRKPDYCHSGKLVLTKNDILGCAEKNLLGGEVLPKLFLWSHHVQQENIHFALKES